MTAKTSKPWKVVGGKKDVSGAMAPYDPLAVEEGWYDWWDSCGFFKPRSDYEAWPPERVQKEGQFVVCLPPPNVTGSLHIGHALTNAVQDALVRWRRMKGENVLWIPGADHAGIATQSVVEKRLQREENLTRHDLGREKFIEKVWEWKHRYSATIKDQLKKTASSLDWSREFFTLDDARATAVTEAFCRMHEMGIIKRDTRLVNWCVSLQSAISDLEVEYLECKGETKVVVPGYDRKVAVGLIYDFCYEVVGTGEKLQVSTTRPETILGDTGVAVHPDDERYKHLHGKKVKCPFRDAEIPIITDPKLVDMAFGTGVVKITPAHDPNDFECGNRHKLQSLSMLSKEGTISMEGQFFGQKRFDCRENIIKALTEKGLFVGKKPHEMKIGLCSRTNDIIEPYLMPQWFVTCKAAADEALKLERENVLKLIPKRYSRIWDHWLGEIRPWCISRQLWWGHRIPAYECFIDGQPAAEDHWVSGRTDEDAKAKAIKQFKLSEAQAAKLELKRDEDVLDTWFSSGLLPHSALGWPNEDAKDFKQFFPTQLLETGHDILFFWVARMVMTSLIFLKKLPFEYVYLHAMVRDKQGKKMSKGRGNVVDPLDIRNGITLAELQNKLKDGNLDPKKVPEAVELQKQMFPDGIKTCGCDALRIGLLANTSSGADVHLDINKVTAYRYFCNKLWNAVKFGLDFSLGQAYEPPAGELKAPLLNEDGSRFQPWDKNELVDQVTKTLKSRCTGFSDGDHSLPFACHWILNRLDRAVSDVNKHFTNYEFAEAVRACYAFWYSDFCDNFLEMTKPFVKDDTSKDKSIFQHVLFTCLETGLRMLHPLLPFTTEELWNRLPGDKEARGPSIMVADYPLPTGWANPGIDAKMGSVLNLIHGIRGMKARYQLSDKVEPTVFISCKAGEELAFMQGEATYITSICRIGKTTFVAGDDGITSGCVVQVISPTVNCHMHIADLIDVKAELKKVAKQTDLLKKSIESLEKKMAAPEYESRVPENVRAEQATKLAGYKVEVSEYEMVADNLRKM